MYRGRRVCSTKRPRANSPERCRDGALRNQQTNTRSCGSRRPGSQRRPCGYRERQRRDSSSIDRQRFSAEGLSSPSYEEPEFASQAPRRSAPLKHLKSPSRRRWYKMRNLRCYPFRLSFPCFLISFILAFTVYWLYKYNLIQSQSDVSETTSYKQPEFSETTLYKQPEFSGDTTIKIFLRRGGPRKVGEGRRRTSGEGGDQIGSSEYVTKGGSGIDSSTQVSRSTVSEDGVTEGGKDASRKVDVSESTSRKYIITEASGRDDGASKSENKGIKSEYAVTEASTSEATVTEASTSEAAATKASGDDGVSGGDKRVISIDVGGPTRRVESKNNNVKDLEDDGDEIDDRQVGNRKGFTYKTGRKHVVGEDRFQVDGDERRSEDTGDRPRNGGGIYIEDIGSDDDKDIAKDEGPGIGVFVELSGNDVFGGGERGVRQDVGGDRDGGGVAAGVDELAPWEAIGWGGGDQVRGDTQRGVTKGDSQGVTKVSSRSLSVSLEVGAGITVRSGQGFKSNLRVNPWLTLNPGNLMVKPWVTLNTNEGSGGLNPRVTQSPRVNPWVTLNPGNLMVKPWVTLKTNEGSGGQGGGSLEVIDNHGSFSESRGGQVVGNADRDDQVVGNADRGGQIVGNAGRGSLVINSKVRVEDRGLIGIENHRYQGNKSHQNQIDEITNWEPFNELHDTKILDDHHSIESDLEIGGGGGDESQIIGWEDGYGPIGDDVDTQVRSWEDARDQIGRRQLEKKYDTKEIIRTKQASGQNCLQFGANWSKCWLKWAAAILALCGISVVIFCCMNFACWFIYLIILLVIITLYILKYVMKTEFKN